MNRLTQMLAELSTAFGPSGFEDEVLAVARKYAPQSARLQEDSLRNLYIRRPQDEGGEKPAVLLDAHSDEVGFMVQAIRPNGLMSFVPVGSWVNSTLPAHRVRIKNRKGELVSGVISSKPPHYLSERERNAPLDMSNMFIDVGASSAEEVGEIFQIGVGAPVAPDSPFEYNESTGVALGKAFDCRAGCACLLEVMGALEKEDLPFSVVGALAAQEEVGVRGATVTARQTAPAAAICFEGCPADDNFAQPWATQTALKKGPMLRHIDSGMIANPRFMRFTLDVAQREGIPVQEAVRSGGSTNGRAISLSGAGVPTIVIGIPVRYIHTHYGYAAMEDIRNSVELGLAVLRALSPEIIAGF